MKLVYTAGPITGGARDPWQQHLNEEAGLAAAREIWQMGGIAPICPMGNTLHMGFLDVSREEAYRLFLDGDFEMIRRCDAIVMLPNWDISRGAIGERQVAMEAGLPVFYWPQDREKIKQFALGVK